MKTILKLTTIALLVGGLMLHFSLNKINSNNGLVSLKGIVGMAEAQAEPGGDCPTCKEDDYCDKHDPTQGYACNTGGDGVLCLMNYVCP